MDIVHVLSLKRILAVCSILALSGVMIPVVIFDSSIHLLKPANGGFPVNADLGIRALVTQEMPADIEDLSIPGGPRGHVDIRIIRPKGSTEALPAVMYYHGGGWMIGNKYMYDRLVRELVNEANVAVVFVEYTHSPGVKYPVANEEAYYALKYVANNSKQLNLDPSRLAVAGDSAGGNMATVMTIMAKQRGGPKIKCQVLFNPVTDASFDTPSYRQFSTGYLLDRDTMKMFWDNYLPDIEARRQLTASPLEASMDQLKGLPPALVITSEYDVLRDEGEAYAHKLSDAGVPTTGVQYLGMTHDFISDDALVDTPASRDAIDLTCNTLREAFAQ